MLQLIRHIKAYIILALIFAVGVWGFFWFSYDRAAQALIAIAFCASYVIWGIIHHLWENQLYPRIVFEYVGISFLGLVLLLTVIYRT